jgi:hypothetical protein
MESCRTVKLSESGALLQPLQHTLARDKVSIKHESRTGIWSLLLEWMKGNFSENKLVYWEFSKKSTNNRQKERTCSHAV